MIDFGEHCELSPPTLRPVCMFYTACPCRAPCPLQVSDSKPLFTASVRSPHRRLPEGQAKIQTLLTASSTCLSSNRKPGFSSYVNNSLYFSLSILPLGSLAEWISQGESLGWQWPLGLTSRSWLEPRHVTWEGPGDCSGQLAVEMV